MTVQYTHHTLIQAQHCHHRNDLRQRPDHQMRFRNNSHMVTRIGFQLLFYCKWVLCNSSALILSVERKSAAIWCSALVLAAGTLQLFISYFLPDYDVLTRVRCLSYKPLAHTASHQVPGQLPLGLQNAAVKEVNAPQLQTPRLDPKYI